MQRTALFITSLLLVLPALADDAHHPEKTAQPAKPAATPVPVEKMQQQAKKAQELMTKIQKNNNPAERQKLMHEHMQAMSDGMGMMREMGGGMMTGMDSGKGAGMKGNATMEMRMDMMQTMMEQMMQHQAAAESMPNSAKP